jgi:protein-disulfide isomerase
MPKSKMDEEKKGDVIEIDFSFLRKIRDVKIAKNPWVLTTIALVVVLGFMLFFNGGFSGGVGADKAGENLVGFINSQGTNVGLVSSEKNGGLYEVIIDAEGQQVPIFVTLDGKFAFLASDAIPISESAGSGTDNSGSGVDSGGSGSGSVGSVDIGRSPVKGSETAKVTIIEFSDYECPFCGRFFDQTLGLIEENYIDTGKVKLVYKDFPLNSIHPQAQIAAEAVRCVGDVKGDEGYFKMHDLIFKNQASLSESNLKKWASQLGVNINSCLESGKHTEDVLADLSYGQQLGVSGTPGFFIGNEEQGYTMLSGALPYSSFEQVIEGYLA